MKILSITHDDGRVVELTQEEFVEFERLAHAIEGMTREEAHWDFALMNGRAELRIDSEVRFNGVFGAIRAFYESQYRVNELRRLVDGLDAAVNKQHTPAG